MFHFKRQWLHGVKVKRSHLLVLSVTALLFSLQPHSSAIFGLSACERMVSSVKTQDQLIRALWTNYNAERKTLPSLSMGGDASLYRLHSQISENLMGKVIDLNRASLKALDLMKRQPKCFSTNTFSRIINERTLMTKYTKDWTTAFNVRPIPSYDYSRLLLQAPISYLKLFPKK